MIIIKLTFQQCSLGQNVRFVMKVTSYTRYILLKKKQNLLMQKLSYFSTVHYAYTDLYNIN